MEIGLGGKVALVTGGSRGIGRAIAERLAAEGAAVAVNFLRNRRAADEVVAAIESVGGRAIAIRGNVAEPEQIDRIVAGVQEAFGRLDIVVHNAASGVLRPHEELTQHHWHWTMDINAWPIFSIAQRTAPLLSGGGRIIAISSLGATRALPYYTLVGASKAALESLVRHLSRELAPRGIHVNVVSAGAVDTDALKHFPNHDQMVEEATQRVPAGRMVTPQDVANVVLFLCSNLADMIHGQTIVVDGGYAILG